MKKKFAVVKVHGQFSTFITIMDNDEFCTCLAKTDILFESDSFKDVCDWKNDYINKVTEV